MPEKVTPKNWWHSRWWLQEEYVRIYSEKASTEEVDSAISRVTDLYDSKWAEQTPYHPVYCWLLSQGLLPLQFLYQLGQDLLELDGSLRLSSVIADLRNPGNYESARFEMGIAAHLKMKGSRVEFRPPLPNGREADFVAAYEGEQVYFEIKRFQDSRAQLALDHLTRTVSIELSSLTGEGGPPNLRGRHYQIDIDGAVSLLLGSDPQYDSVLIEGIKNQIVEEVLNRTQTGTEVDFEIVSVAKVRILNLPREGSSVSSPIVNSASELRRVVGRGLQEAVEQLHPEHPGIIVIQTPGGLELDLTRAVVNGVFHGLRTKASHLSAVVFLPVSYSFPTAWAYFRPFVVSNGNARMPAAQLRVFEDLKSLLDVTLQTPGE